MDYSWFREITWVLVEFVLNSLLEIWFNDHYPTTYTSLTFDSLIVIIDWALTEFPYAGDASLPNHI